MANTFILGGSPLGLIGAKSRPTDNGISTFVSGDKSTNTNVFAYNTGRPQTTNIITSDGKQVTASISLFTGDNRVNLFPNVGKRGTDISPYGEDDGSVYKGIQRNQLHNDDTYDMSLLNILEKLSVSSKAALRAQDFAYLKNLGVYPNNRLVIARRFVSPQRDDILGKGGERPLAVMITWRKETEDFLEITFGEEWTDAEADFTNVLNSLGGDLKIGGLGSGAASGFGVIPLPSFTEYAQRIFLEKIGVLEPITDGNVSIASKPLPSGDPNIIKKAKRRKTFGWGSADSGLRCTINVKMTVEYEQKFISGIDPTLAWMDILGNALHFGTSKNNVYGLSKKLTQNINKWTKPNGIKDLISDIVTALKNVVDYIKELANEAIGKLKQGVDIVKDAATNPTEAVNNAADQSGDLLKRVKELSGSVIDLFFNSIGKIINKYRNELMGIAFALSGLPSTPWHVTIGNPLRPIFSSGDMYMSGDVSLKLGPTLAFNDLPSNITVDFTLNNARPLGLQEILAKFNSGNLRVISQPRYDFVSANAEASKETKTTKVDTSGDSGSSSGTTAATASNPLGGLNTGTASGGTASTP
jgi:hypothetical protein